MGPTPNSPLYLAEHGVMLFTDSGNSSVSFYVMDVMRGNTTAVWTGHSYGGLTLCADFL